MDGITDMQEIIAGRLFFASTAKSPKSSTQRVYFCVDDELVYQSFYADFGPLNLGMLRRYCVKVDHLLKLHPDKVVVHITSHDVHKRANAAYLAAAYSLIHHGKSVEAACRPFSTLSPPLLPFRDAAYGGCTYKLTLQDCISGLAKAIEHKFVEFDNFDLAEYEHYERVENGDLNWIIPGKFIAFAGPHNTNKSETGYPMHMPSHYFDYFKDNNVTDIVRLNVKLYDSAHFTQQGFNHHELYFDDGTCPTPEILDRFLQISERASGALAVHCKAGLGRTGTLICCYMMKHYGFTASEAIAWNRIARPGSVIGPQQYYLQSQQHTMWQLGALRSPSPAVQPEQSSPKIDNQLSSGVESLSLTGARSSQAASINAELTTMTQGDLLNSKKAQAQRLVRGRSSSSNILALFSTPRKASKIA